MFIASDCVSNNTDFCVVVFEQNFVFQAEDGIRGRSPSRGLGEVYMRQPLHAALILTCKVTQPAAGIIPP